MTIEVGQCDQCMAFALCAADHEEDCDRYEDDQ